MSADPSLDEMLAVITASGPPLGMSAEIAEGIYWFAAERHTGQGSNLYEAMEKCGWKPGLISVLSSESLASIVYEILRDAYDVPMPDVIDSLLAGVTAPEDKDLYDKE